MQRIHALTRPSTAIPERPSALARRLWCDTVSHGSGPALRCARDTFGTGRLLLGTDYPYVRGDALRRAITYVEQADPPLQEIRAILDQNAPDLLGLA